MATTIKESFRQYAKNLEITDRQETLVASRRANVVRVLRNKLSLHDEESKVIGSWDRNTLTRYLYEGDVDLMVVLHYGEHKDWYSGPGTIACLNRFRSILDEAYPDTEKRRDANCITMKFNEFRLDVVPAFKFDTGRYRIPDSVRQQWIETDPFSFAAKVTRVNTGMEQDFVPLIKMVKGWNREVGWPIRSFHLECMLYEHYRNYTETYTYNSMLKIFFSRLPDYLRNASYCSGPMKLDSGTS